MKFIEKLTLIIYSNLILVLSIVTLFTIFGWIDLETVLQLEKTLIISDTSSKVLIGLGIIFIILSIRCIFFDPTSKQAELDRQGVLLGNDNGKLMISKQTIDDIVETVTKGFSDTRDVSSRVELDKDNNIIIYVNLAVSSDAVIKDLSTDLQNKIKAKVKETTDLDVKAVNINVKKAVPDKKANA